LRRWGLPAAGSPWARCWAASSLSGRRESLQERPTFPWPQAPGLSDSVLSLPKGEVTTA